MGKKGTKTLKLNTENHQATQALKPGIYPTLAGISVQFQFPTCLCAVSQPLECSFLVKACYSSCFKVQLQCLSDTINKT